ncbi:MAG TPA: NAD-binding protein [Myxococcales bacterium]|nr:NAD-binding protein [Myxococcales bacterium]
MIRAPGRTLRAQVLYLWVLVRRFKLTFFSLALLVFGGGTLMWRLYAHIGQPITWSRAIFGAYFLLFAQPTMEIPDYPPLEALFTIIPPLGIITVAEGLVRFAVLFFAKTRNDKEWFAVLAQTVKDHVIVCGAGRVGFRLFEQFTKLDVPLVMIERDGQAPFVSAIRGAGVPVLIEDVRATRALEEANIRSARAIVCATDDDLVNLNIALDARRLNPGIRVVMRLFDDDLVAKTKEAFQVEAFSTSALAAPALAAAALDPSIRNSFEIGGRLMVIADLQVGAMLENKTIAELRDGSATLVVHLVRADGSTQFEPAGTVRLSRGDRVTVQATLSAYRELRARMGRAA